MKVRTQEEWIGEYESLGALWIHDGDMSKPHAELTSGKHSNGFFNSSLVIQHPTLMVEAIRNLIGDLVLESGEHIVIGSAMGAITFLMKWDVN